MKMKKAREAANLFALEYVCPHTMKPETFFEIGYVKILKLIFMVGMLYVICEESVKKIYKN